MKYCMKCGVKLDEENNRVCPLCNTIILTDEEINELSCKEMKIIQTLKKDEKKIITVKEKKNKTGITSIIMLFSSFVAIFTLLIVDLSIELNINWSIIPIISVILFILTVSFPFMNPRKSIYWYSTFDTVVLCVYFIILNYILNNGISWSYYVVLSLLLAWFYLSAILVNKIKGFIIKISIGFVATAIFVLLVTLGNNNSSGFSELALPINGLVFILTVISYLFIKTYVYNWRIIISTLSINVSILCIGIDLLIQRYVHAQLYLGWSYIVLFVLIPFTLFMFYLDNRYKIHKYLIKKFHI